LTKLSPNKLKRQIEGRNPVLESLRAKSPLKKIFLDQASKPDSKIKEILSLARRQHILLKKTNRKFLNKISRTASHQGIIAYAETQPTSLSYILNSTASPFLVILTEVLYEQNLGAILRSAEAAGVNAVIIPKKGQGVTPVVARTSMGASEYLPVIQEGLFSTLKQIRKLGVRIIGADQNAKMIYYQENLKGPIAFIIGGEDKGLTSQIKNQCHCLVKIPLKGKITSLNMSVATAILLFEKNRQDSV
jgi:23S rRNA (guanosine2251-2'-O)-methyltransferase